MGRYNRKFRIKMRTIKLITKKGRETLHKTVLRTHNVKFNQNHPEEIFTQRQLEKGP